jgi:hypothetical protein
MKENRYIVKVKNVQTKETRTRNVKLNKEQYLKMLKELNRIDLKGFQLVSIIEFDECL